LHPIPDSYIERTFEECMKSDTYVKIYIMEYEGKPAGYGMLVKTFSQEAGGYVYWLEELYIMEKYRSKGLGSEFFNYVEKNREEEVTRFRLEVEEDNTRARELYKRLGYKDLDYRQMVKTF
ncbi:MAG TPA: N-acetyltransferase, partial [Lachnospiraceae bacterium]|nr:N-acetyltransferase [Lachnospiraceae bacterium]